MPVFQPMRGCLKAFQSVNLQDCMVEFPEQSLPAETVRLADGTLMSLGELMGFWGLPVPQIWYGALVPSECLQRMLQQQWTAILLWLSPTSLRFLHGCVFPPASWITMVRDRLWLGKHDLRDHKPKPQLEGRFWHLLLKHLQQWAPCLRQHFASAMATIEQQEEAFLELEALAGDVYTFGQAFLSKDANLVSEALRKESYSAAQLLECVLHARFLRNMSEQRSEVLQALRTVAPSPLRAQTLVSHVAPWPQLGVEDGLAPLFCVSGGQHFGWKFGQFQTFKKLYFAFDRFWLVVKTFQARNQEHVQKLKRVLSAEDDNRHLTLWFHSSSLPFVKHILVLRPPRPHKQQVPCKEGRSCAGNASGRGTCSWMICVLSSEAYLEQHVGVALPKKTLLYASLLTVDVAYMSYLRQTCAFADCVLYVWADSSPQVGMLHGRKATPWWWKLGLWSPNSHQHRWRTFQTEMLT